MQTIVMSQKETMEYIDSIQSYGSVLGLDNMERLCKKLESPQDKLKIIHIAGTNGKGSTLAFVSTILKEAKYKVGRYISPVIFDYRERIQINGRMISRKDLCIYMTRLKKACDEIVAEGFAHPTPFEIETALAFLYFAEKECDIVVLETGLGGREDATNIIKNPLISVLTSISMDHMGVLGNTLAEIAEVKCGIIKKGCPVVSTYQEKEVEAVIMKTCEKKQAFLHMTSKKDISKIKLGINKQSFTYREYGKCEMTLTGTYQIQNAALALDVVDELNALGFRVSGQAALRGLKNAEWLGRFSVISKQPLFIVDGAHNEDASLKLAESIRFYFTNKKIIYIMGVLKDKEYVKIIENTVPYAKQIITVKTPDNVRAMDQYELAKVVSEYHPNVTMADSLEEAVEVAYLMADKDSVVLAFGSLSYLGKLINIVRNRDKKIVDSHGIQMK